MEIIGQRVRHKTLGLGSISTFADSRIAVKFDTRPAESTFIFPDAFNDHLSFVDAALQNQVNALLAAKSKSPEKSLPKVAAAAKKTSQTVLNSNPSAGVKEQPKSRINSFSGTTIPSSAILLGSVLGNKKKYDILIVGDSNQQKSAEGIYWKNRELSKSILEAHFSGTNSFLFDGVRYSLESVTKYARYSAEKSKWVKFNSIAEAKELYVFKQKGVYDNPENGYELVDAKLYFPQKKQAIKVAVYYQASQSRFFMNEESFVPLVRAHGLPNVSLHFTEDTGSDTIWAGKFNEQSKLKMLGYNVQQADGMSSGERQNLLSSIIRSGQMTDAEVANHLEMLIHLNSGKPNMFNACGSWREDLEFVQNNFGDMRRQKDFYGTKTSSGGSTSQRKTSQPSSKPASGPSKTYSPSKEKTAKTTKPQNQSNTPKQPDPRMPLLKKRAQLLSELDSATGLFNIFKRMRLKREIREVEDKLNETP